MHLMMCLRCLRTSIFGYTRWKKRLNESNMDDHRSCKNTHNERRDETNPDLGMMMTSCRIKAKAPIFDGVCDPEVFGDWLMDML